MSNISVRKNKYEKQQSLCKYIGCVSMRSLKCDEQACQIRVLQNQIENIQWNWRQGQEQKELKT